MNRRQQHRRNLKENKRERRERRKWLKHNDIHHVIPRSRCKELRVNPEALKNKVRVDAKKHSLYHALVGNMTPEEAFDYFLKTFWNEMILPPKKFDENGNNNESEEPTQC